MLTYEIERFVPIHNHRDQLVFMVLFNHTIFEETFTFTRYFILPHIKYLDVTSAHVQATIFDAKMIQASDKPIIHPNIGTYKNVIEADFVNDKNISLRIHLIQHGVAQHA